MGNTDRKYEVKGFETYDCIDFIEEKPSKHKHFLATEDMFNNVDAMREELGMKSLGSVTGLIISDAVEKGFKPFKTKLKPEQKIRFKTCEKSMNCYLREAEFDRLNKLAEETGISSTDYIRLALSYYFANGKTFE